jgi:O-antigen/teichoic acid export membrane protein
VLRDAFLAALQLVLFWAVSGYRFQGRVSRAGAGQLLPFARQMFLSRSLMIMLQRLDRLAAGLFLGNAATGLYDRARFLAETGILATQPLNRLAFNLYSRTQNDAGRLARSYRLLNYFLSRLITAGAVSLVIFPAETIRLLYGPEFVEAAPVLRWLGIYGALLPVFQNLRQLFNGVGKVAWNVRINLLQVLIFAPGVLAASIVGSPTAVAVALLASTVVAFAVGWRWAEGIVEGPAAGGLALPAVLLVGVAALFLWLDAAESLRTLPWWALPFLPPVAYAAALLAFEGRTLFRELGYLRSQLGATRAS